MFDSVFNIFNSTEKWQPKLLLSILLLTTTFIFVLQYHWKRRHLYKLAAKIPGPKGYPLFGQLFDFTGGPDEIYNKVMEHLSFRPGLAKFWYGPSLVFGVSKPEYLEAVLTSPKAFSKMYLYRYAETLVGHGLFTAPVPTWKRHRKIVMPAFNQKILDSFVHIFAKQSTKMCDQLEKFEGKGEFDFFEVVSKCTLDIFCETAMGIEVDGQTGDTDFGQWVERLLEIMFLRMFVVWYHFDFIFKWTKLYQEERTVMKKFKDFTQTVIAERRNTFKRNQKATTKFKPFLDLLLEMSSNGDQLTEDEIRDEVNTFMVAGTDTTASTMGYIFLLLGMHPHIQDKIYREVIEILDERTVEPQDLPLLSYTERAIKESLRLFPVGAFIVRDLTDDLVFEDGVVLPKGSSTLLGIMHIHRDGTYWPNPLEFDPDRFLPEEVAERHPFSYLPFSGGPRNCIGPRYAMMAMKAMVATIVRRFEFRTSYKRVEDVELKTSLVLKPKNGFMVSVQCRK